jgi:hypothetical protein
VGKITSALLGNFTSTLTADGFVELIERSRTDAAEVGRSYANAGQILIGAVGR